MLCRRNYLELTNITKIYGNVVELNNVNLVLQPRRIVGLLGPNGSGKTTLLKMFILLLSSSMFTTSLTTLIFIIVKCFFSNGKGLKIIAYFCEVIVINIFLSKPLAEIKNIMGSYDNYYVIYSLVLLLI